MGGQKGSRNNNTLYWEPLALCLWMEWGQQIEVASSESDRCLSTGRNHCPFVLRSIVLEAKTQNHFYRSQWSCAQQLNDTTPSCVLCIENGGRCRLIFIYNKHIDMYVYLLIYIFRFYIPVISFPSLKPTFGLVEGCALTFALENLMAKTCLGCRYRASPKDEFLPTYNQQFLQSESVLPS